MRRAAARFRRWWLGGGERERLAAEAAARVRAEDPLGDRLHTWAAMLTLFMLTLPTSLAELALIPGSTAALIRFARCWPVYRVALADAVPVLIGATAAWLAVGLLWTSSLDLGIEEFGAVRWFVVVIVAMPVLHARIGLIAAMAAGLAVGHLVQGLNAWALHGGGPAWLSFGRLPTRISGWWDPAVGGTILAAGLGLHLPAALFGRGRVRWLAVAMAAVTLAGLLATGSRGGWLAGAGLAVMATGFAALRGLRARFSGSLVLGTLALVVAAGVAALLLRGPVVDRATDAARDIRRAVTAGDFDSDTGARIGMKLWALEAAATAPLTGVGTGGYAAWVRGSAAPPALHGRVHDHAHDTALHLLASNGLVGLALAGLLAAAVISRAWRIAIADLGSYRAGPLFALLGLGLAMPFDTLHVSGSAAAVLGGLTACCVRGPARATVPDASGRSAG